MKLSDFYIQILKPILAYCVPQSDLTREARGPLVQWGPERCTGCKGDSYATGDQLIFHDKETNKRLNAYIYQIS